MAQQNNVIWFTPYVWAWIQFLKRECKTEAFAFGIARKEEPNLIVDLYIPKQVAGVAFVDIEEEDTLKMVEELVDLGYETGEFMRYFIHTHPGQSPQPSSTDERTYKDIFGKMDWSSMIIFAKDGPTFCRTQFQAGPGATIDGDLRVYFSGLFPGVDQDVINGWEALRKDRITERQYVHHGNGNGNHTGRGGGVGYSNEFGRWENGVWIRNGERRSLGLYDRLPDDFDFRTDDEYWATYLEQLAEEEGEKKSRRKKMKQGEYHFLYGDFTHKERVKMDKAKEELSEVADPEPVLVEKRMNLKYPNVNSTLVVTIATGTAQEQFSKAVSYLDNRYEEGVRQEFLKVMTAILKERRAAIKKAAPAASTEVVVVSATQQGPYPIPVD